MTDYIILMPLLILIFGLTPIVARDSYLNKNQKNIMLWIIGLIGVLIAQNVCGQYAVSQNAGEHRGLLRPTGHYHTVLQAGKAER